MESCEGAKAGWGQGDPRPVELAGERGVGGVPCPEAATGERGEVGSGQLPDKSQKWTFSGQPRWSESFQGVGPALKGPLFGTLGISDWPHSARTVSGDGSVYGPTICSRRCLGSWVGGNATRGRSLIVELAGVGRAGERRGPARAVRALV